MALGNPAEAATAYQQVIDRAGNAIYGQMARLGLAEAQARAGQYDQAINTFKELAQRKDGPLPVDGILMQLGRTYLEAGKRDRRAADVQPPGRGIPGVAVQRRRASASSTSLKKAYLAALARDFAAEPVRQDLVDQLRAQEVRRDVAARSATARRDRTRRPFRASITRRSSASISYHASPPGSGVPTAGMIAGSKPSTSIVM